MKQINVKLVQTLSKTFKIDIYDTEDESSNGIIDTFYEQRWDIVGLLKELKSYLMQELYFQDRRQHRIARLLEILDSCKDWTVEETIITNEKDSKNTESAVTSKS